MENVQHVHRQCQIVPPAQVMEAHVLHAQRTIIDQRRKHVHCAHPLQIVLNVQRMQTNVQSARMDSIPVEHHVFHVVQKDVKIVTHQQDHVQSVENSNI